MPLPLDADPVIIDRDTAIEAVRDAAFTEHIDPEDGDDMPSYSDLLQLVRDAADAIRVEAQDPIGAATATGRVLARIDAIPEPPKPRTLIHSFLGSFGADHDLDSAIETIRGAERVAWAPSLFGHELGVEVVEGGESRVYRFAVEAPDGVGAAAG